MRYFVQFKPNTTLNNKLMVFTNLTKQQVHDIMHRNYGKAVANILSEPECAALLPAMYDCTNHWVSYGYPCTYTERNCDGESTKNIQYPVSANTPLYAPHAVSVDDITAWFSTAKPNPTTANLSTQIGAHIEEFIEMLEALGESVPQALTSIKEKYYQGVEIDLTSEAKVALLDSLADQVVTATGVAYFNGFDFDGALTNVNQSNWSKFEDGKPILNENGKIMKGKDYVAPSLEQFVTKG